MRNAFTLIELLVVITIIVVLLALLTPALDKAIYQAQLARCAGNLRPAGSGILQYAFANRRYYPDRGFAQAQQQATYQYSYIAPTALSEKVYLMWDMRPSVKSFIQINKQLVDPLCQPVELEVDRLPDENVGASYTMWWGWRYDLTNNQRDAGSRGQAFAGMMKLGDRWSWDNNEFSLLAGDFDLGLGGGDANPIQGSHPDRDGKMASFAFKYEPLFGTGAGVPFTQSLWMRRGASDRGPIDVNHLYDDNSVRRYEGVKSWMDRSAKDRDPRMTLVPNMANAQQGWKFYQVPKS